MSKFYLTSIVQAKEVTRKCVAEHIPFVFTPPAEHEEYNATIEVDSIYRPYVQGYLKP